jgi:drug/metabolite transporter (DMT)-like permease
LLGVVFSLLSAATFALNAVAARRAVLSGTVLQGLMVTVPLGVPLFVLLMVLAGETHMLGKFSGEAIFWFAAAGIVHFVIGRYGNYAASAAIGVNLASPILQCEVLITLVLAIVMLGEYLTPLRALGIALVLIGPGLIVNRDDQRKAQSASAATNAVANAGPNAAQNPAQKAEFKPRYVEGYLYSVLAAVGYGLSPVCIGLGLKAAGGTGVLAGGLVSYIAASLIVALILIVLRPPASTFRMSATALKWFVFAGCIVFFSHAFRYAAIALAPVSVVTALQRLSSLFRIYFSWIINRDHEVFDESVIAATVVSMIGAIALSVSTETFLSLADWPDWLVTIARMRWP